MVRAVAVGHVGRLGHVGRCAAGVDVVRHRSVQRRRYAGSLHPRGRQPCHRGGGDGHRQSGEPDRCRVRTRQGPTRRAADGGSAHSRVGAGRGALVVRGAHRVHRSLRAPVLHRPGWRHRVPRQRRTRLSRLRLLRAHRRHVVRSQRHRRHQSRDPAHHPAARARELPVRHGHRRSHDQRARHLHPAGVAGGRGCITPGWGRATGRCRRRAAACR